MNIRYLPPWMVCLPILLAGCGQRHELRVQDYDQSCSKDEDCKTVLVGDLCECSCDTAAINNGAVDDYTGDVTELKAECVEKAAKCAECPDLAGSICVAGKCQVEGKGLPTR